VHALAVDDATGHRHHLVLRRWPPAGEDDGTDCVRREALVLTGLERTDIPAPALVATDPDGRHCGVPSLLMTRVAGRVDLQPKDVPSWVRQLAEMMARIHDTNLPTAPTFESWLHRERLAVPDWTIRPGLWRMAIELVQSDPPVVEQRLVHHDYQQFNVLWSRGRLTAVVDWVWGSLGPPDADVAHCRLNLAMLYSSERAESFRRAYESCAGRSVDPWWDMAGLLSYLSGWRSALQRQAGSGLAVDFEGMNDRVEATVEAVLGRC
jgi:aminoglycoside phosphotransferase (APT) family kinase protein